MKTVRQIAITITITAIITLILATTVDAADPISEFSRKLKAGVEKILGNRSEPKVVKQFRVATYNIAYGRGNDRGGLSELGGKPQCLFGVGGLLKKHAIDIAGITEISFADFRGGLTNQPATLSLASGMQHHVYGENHRFGLILISVGNAIFSKYPIISWQNHKLFRKDNDNEQRGCLEALIDLGNGRKVRAFVAHLSLNSKESLTQKKQIWDIIKSRSEPCILMGDFNTTPGSPNINFLSSNMTDISQNVPGTYWPKSFQNEGKSKVKLDYIFIRGAVEAAGDAWVSGFEEGYSDHGCLAVKLNLK